MFQGCPRDWSTEAVFRPDSQRTVGRVVAETRTSTARLWRRQSAHMWHEVVQQGHGRLSRANRTNRERLLRLLTTVFIIKMCVMLCENICVSSVSRLWLGSAAFWPETLSQVRVNSTFIRHYPWQLFHKMLSHSGIRPTCSHSKIPGTAQLQRDI